MPRTHRSIYKRKTRSATDLVRSSRLHIMRKDVKHARITVHHDGRVQFVAPQRYTIERIHTLLRKHTDWIEKQRQRFSELARIEVGSDQLLYRGKLYTFRRAPRQGEEVLIDHADGIITCGVDLQEARTLQHWYTDEAHRIIAPRVAQLAARHGLHYSALRITSPKTIWGSCTAAGVISINWRLIKAPPAVLDYLIIHELVHTQIDDHSSRFWKRVATLCPDYTRSIEWLKTYGRWI